MTLVEVILIAVFLIGTTLGTAFFFTQTKIIMKSSSQIMGCQTIAKEALENTVSLGTRLYGYRIKHSTSNLNYTPLFITKNTKAYDVDNNIKDVGDGSEFSFPPEMYQELYKNLVGMDISPPIKVSPQSNTGQLIISDKSLHPIEISTSTLIVNSINALQYLYNSDPAYSIGDGKDISSSSGLMSSLLQKYKDQFDLDNIQFYVKITPLRNSAIITTRPILTRPRFLINSNEISSDLTILGDENIEFEIKVKLKYVHNGQNFDCEGMHKFRHQMTGESGNPKALDVTLKTLSNGAGEVLNTPKSINTSCDTHGSGYDDITLTLDFNTVTKSPQVGTVILCQMNSYCRSEGDDGDYTHSGIICTPEMGHWQRCHHIQPKTHSDQSWTFKAKLKTQQELTMQFDDMKINRRYDLNIAEFAIDGEKVREQKVIFYVDSGRRPYIEIADRNITDDDVGLPTDNQKERNYNGPNTNWKIPIDALSNKWLQCNQSDVDFEVTLKDQFIHNLKNCDVEGIRKDGNGTSAITTDITNHISEGRFCKSTLASIQHGRQTINFKPKDTCGYGTPRDLVWNTDLPSTFESKGFFDDSDEDPNDGVIWLKTQIDYPIKTKVPAKTTSGKFPKHYSLDCQDKYIGNTMRDDGNGGPLVCTLKNVEASDADGANPGDFDIKFYHVCGTSECKESKWAVYPPVAGSCKNVKCERGYICCNDPLGDCGGVQNQQCQEDKWPHACDNPPCGSNTSSREGCPPFGLYDCHYGTWRCAGAYDDDGHTTEGTDCGCANRGINRGSNQCDRYAYGPKNSQGIGSVSCASPLGGTTPIVAGDGYRIIYKGTPNPENCKNCYSQKTSDGSLSPPGSIGYRCSFRKTWSCGHSNKSHPCPFLPKYHGNSCTGTRGCNKFGADCAKWNDKGTSCLEQVCLEPEEPYYLSCTLTFRGGTCGEPTGGCTPRGRAGGNINKEKATQRSVCKHCNSKQKCCSGDSYPSNPNCS